MSITKLESVWTFKVSIPLYKSSCATKGALFIIRVWGSLEYTVRTLDSKLGTLTLILNSRFSHAHDDNSYKELDFDRKS